MDHMEDYIISFFIAVFAPIVKDGLYSLWRKLHTKKAKKKSPSRKKHKH